MPEGRPYDLGTTSADQASINATSEMSASSRARSRGRTPDNPRSVSYEAVGGYEAHQVGRAESSDTKSEEGAGEKVSGDLFRLMSVLLHVLDEVAPGAHLSADVHELREDGDQETRIAK